MKRTRPAVLNLVIGILIIGWMQGCGTEENSFSTLQLKTINTKKFALVDQDKALLAVDKYFREAPSLKALQCMKGRGVEMHIATYNAELKGGYGRKVDVHLKNAEAAGMRVSAYFAFNSEKGLQKPYVEEFLRKIAGFNIETVFLDIERPAAEIDELAVRWYHRVCIKAGYRCGVYTNERAMSEARYPREPMMPFEKMYLWYALWGRDPKPTLSLREMKLDEFYGWKQSDAHQFANGSLCDTEVDMNVMNRYIFESDEEDETESTVAAL